MKYLFSFLLICFIGFNSYAQLPVVKLEQLNGKTTTLESLTKNQPTIITFWSSVCKPCLQELEALSEYNEANNVRIIAISIDDNKTLARAKTLAQSKDWNIDVVFDKNQELKRAMGITDIPYLIIADNNGNTVYKHSGYTVGSESDWIEKHQQLIKSTTN